MTEFLCNLIIPGAAKSGTSSLHEALGQHPGLRMSTPKEPQFFSFDERYAQGAAAHNRLFAGASAAQYFGESSQCYLADERAIERIAKSLGSPRIIMLLRDPVDRLLSQYAWNFRRATETAGLFDAITTRGESIDYIYDPRIGMYREVGGYLAFSRYSRWVPLWRERFEHVLCLRFEDFVARQAETLRRCFDFLGVEEVAAVTESRSNTTESTVRAVYPNAVRLGARLVPRFLKKNGFYVSAKNAVLDRFTPVPHLSLVGRQRAFLEAELAPDIAFHRDLRRD